MNLVGVDIGCGLYVVKLKFGKLKMDFDKLDKVICEWVLFGSKIYDKFVDEFDLEGIVVLIYCGWVVRSIGMFGGGNYFIEVN